MGGLSAQEQRRAIGFQRLGRGIELSRGRPEKGRRLKGLNRIGPVAPGGVGGQDQGGDTAVRGPRHADSFGPVAGHVRGR